MLTLILIVLAVLGVVLAFLFLRAAAMGAFVVLAGAWALLRAIFGSSSGRERTEDRKLRKLERVREENRRLTAGEGTLPQIRARMKAEERAARSGR